MNLSICMIIKDEEENLKKLLPILKKFKDNGSELIIVDTGSSDNSIEESKKYTENVYEIEWENDFSKARNFSISNATKDWILILDADEIPTFTPKDVNKIIDSMKKRNYNSCLFFVKFVYPTNFKLDRQIRLFKNGDFKYEGKIFNRLKGKQRLASSNLAIENLGNFHDANNEKAKRDIEILKELVQKENSLFYKFQLLNRYFDIKDYKSVLNHTNDFISYLKNTKKINPMYLKAFILAGKSAMELGNYDQSIMLYKIAIKYYPNFLDAYLFLAETYNKKEDIEKSIQNLERYLELHSKTKENIFDPTLPPIETLPLKANAMYSLLTLYIEQKRAHDFKKYLKEYIETENDIQKLVKVINTFPAYPDLIIEVVKNTRDIRMALYGLHIYATKKIKPKNYKNHMIFLYESTKYMTPAEITWFGNIMKSLVGKDKAIEIYKKYLNECAESQKNIIKQLINKEESND